MSIKHYKNNEKAISDVNASLENNVQQTQQIKFKSNTICLAGDSITALAGGTTTSDRITAEGYFSWANMFLNQRFNVLNNAGVGGFTSAQVLASLDTGVLPYNPNYCMVMCGINDIFTLIDSATTIANLSAIYDKLTKNNIGIITSALMPAAGTSDATAKASIKAINTFIRIYASNNNNVHLLDLAKYYNTVDTGIPPITKSNDGVHPNALGAYWVGKSAYEDLDGIIPKISTFGTDNVVKSALNSNPMMSGDVSGLATGYTIANNLSTIPSKITRTDGIDGTIQKLTSSATNATSSVISPAGHTGVAVGDKIALQIEIETDDLTSVKQLCAALEVRNVTNDAIKIAEAMYISAGSFNLPKFVGVIKTRPIVVPVGYSYLFSYFTYNFTGVINIKRWEVIKV